MESKLPGYRPLRCNWGLVAYLVVVVCSLFVARQKMLSLFEIFLVLQAFFLFFYVANNLRTRNDIIFVLALLMIGMVLQGGFSMLAHRAGHGYQFGPIQVRIHPTNGRTAGTYGSPILAGSCLAMLMAPTLGAFLTLRNGIWRWLALLALISGGVGLVLTQSRGSWIGTALSCSTLTLLMWKRGWLSERMVVCAGVAAACLLVTFQGTVLGRVFGDDAGSAAARIPLARMAMAMIVDHPLGVGINNCALTAQRYSETVAFRHDWFYTIHNKYLLVWVETGLLGLTAFLSFLGGTVYVGLLGWRHLDRLLAVTALAMALAVCGQALHMCVDVFNSRPQVQLLWLVAGVLTAIRWMEVEVATNG